MKPRPDSWAADAERWSDPRVAEEILRRFHTWAIVGCSSHPSRASHRVSRFLIGRGYDVIPVNPNETAVHGRPAYPDLPSLAADAKRVEVVDLFRRSDRVRAHVVEAIQIGARAIWMQLGVWDAAGAELAAEAGLLVVMNRCPAVDYPALIEAQDRA